MMVTIKMKVTINMKVIVKMKLTAKIVLPEFWEKMSTQKEKKSDK